jgi:hypothetical protein
MNDLLTPLVIVLFVLVAFAAACVFIFWLDGLIGLIQQRKPTRFLILLCLPPVGLWIESRDRYRKWLKKTYLTPKGHLKSIWDSVLNFWKSLDWSI